MDTTIDVMKDNTKTIMEKLYARAYGEEAPDGLYDFAAHTALTRCDEFDSDLHVEFGTDYDMDIEGVSEIDDYPPLIRVQERGPSDNDPTFDWGGIEESFVGTFGTALKSLLKIVAIGNSQSDDMSNLVTYFKRTWGVPDDVDFSTLLPNMRASGPTMLATLNRKLVPFCYAHPAVSGLVKVKFHGVQRRDKLVNWPRISVIAQYIATMLRMEDDFAPKTIKRLDFKINWDEMPDEPKVKHFDFSKLKPPNIHEVNQGAVHLVGYLVQQREKMKLAYMNRARSNVTVDADIPRDVLDRLKYVEMPLHKVKLEIDFDDIQEEHYDVVVPEKRPDLSEIKKKRLSNVQALEKILAAKLYNNATVSGYQLHERANKLDMDRDMDIGPDFNYVLNTVGPNCLKNVYFVLNASGDDMRSAHEKAIGLMKLAGADKSVYKENTYVGLFRLALGKRKVLAFFLRKLAEIANKHLSLHSNELAISKNICKAFKQTGDLNDTFARVVEMRKNWWADRWIKKGKVEGPKRIEYQLKGNWMARARIIVTAEFQVEFGDDGATIVAAIAHTVENFLRKRRENPKYKNVVVPAAFPNVREYARQADQIIQGKTTFVHVLKRLYDAFTLLSKDIYDVCVADPYGLEDPGIKGDFLEDAPIASEVDIEAYVEVDDDGPMDDDYDAEGAEDLDEEDDDSDDIAAIAAPVPVKKEPKVDDDEDDEDDDEDDFIGTKNAAQIDLASELYEDLNNPPFDLVPRLVEQHGARVAFSAYKAILDAARKEVMEALLKKKDEPRAILDDDDIQ